MERKSWTLFGMLGRCWPSSTSQCCQPVNLFCLLPQSPPVSLPDRGSTPPPLPTHPHSHPNDFVPAIVIRHDLGISPSSSSLFWRDAPTPDLSENDRCSCFFFSHLFIPASPSYVFIRHYTYRTHSSRRRPRWPVSMYNLHPITMPLVSFHPAVVGPSLPRSSARSSSLSPSQGFFFFFFTIPLEAIHDLVVRDLATAQLEPSAVIVAIRQAKQNMRGFVIYVNNHRSDSFWLPLVWNEWRW